MVSNEEHGKVDEAELLSVTGVQEHIEMHETSRKKPKFVVHVTLGHGVVVESNEVKSDCDGNQLSVTDDVVLSEGCQATDIENIKNHEQLGESRDSGDDEKAYLLNQNTVPADIDNYVSIENTGGTDHHHSESGQLLVSIPLDKLKLSHRMKERPSGMLPCTSDRQLRSLDALSLQNIKFRNSEGMLSYNDDVRNCRSLQNKSAMCVDSASCSEREDGRDGGSKWKVADRTFSFSSSSAAANDVMVSHEQILECARLEKRDSLTDSDFDGINETDDLSTRGFGDCNKDILVSGDSDSTFEDGASSDDKSDLYEAGNMSQSRGSNTLLLGMAKEQREEKSTYTYICLFVQCKGFLSFREM